MKKKNHHRGVCPFKKQLAIVTGEHEAGKQTQLDLISEIGKIRKTLFSEDAGYQSVDDMVKQIVKIKTLMMERERTPVEFQNSLRLVEIENERLWHILRLHMNDKTLGADVVLETLNGKTFPVVKTVFGYISPEVRNARNYSLNDFRN